MLMVAILLYVLLIHGATIAVISYHEFFTT